METLENKVVVLESTLEVSQNTSDKPSAEVDNLHQYSRRNCLVVSGTPIKHGESTADLKRSIEKNVLKDIGVSKEFFDYEFDKVHRIEAAHGDKQNFIVRFRSHQFPSELYYARKKIKNKKIGFKTLFDKKKEHHFYVISVKKSKLMRIIVIPSNSVILTSTATLKYDCMNCIKANTYTPLLTLIK